MEIVQFDQMMAQDRLAFLDFHTRAAEMILEQEGRSADVAKAHHLFDDILTGDALPIGEAKLEGNPANARVRDVEKHIQNHDAPRFGSDFCQ